MGLFNKKSSKEIIIYSPVDGKIKELKKVDDEVFAQGMVGDGIAVVPTSTSVYSPVSEGVIQTAFATGHAFGMSTKKGPEILVHIGIDTINLKGKGFDSKVKANDKVNLDSVLSDIDLKILKKEAKGIDIMVLATNDSMDGYKIELTKKSGDVKKGEELYKIVKS